jgi:hypothetical protein
MEIAVGIWKDSDAAALDWHITTFLLNQSNAWTFVFETTTADALSHTYTIRHMTSTAGSNAAGTRRRFSYEVAV